MLRQTVMGFKLERTEDRVTARSGLVLYAEFMRAMGVESLIDRHMPKPGSGRGFEAITYIKPLSMALYGGGETIEDVREIREDDSLREVIELDAESKKIIVEERIKEIVSAMRRYQTSRKKIPSEWFEELEQLIFNE